MIYLDNAATTKPIVSAMEYAQKFNTEYFYNPSALYRQGLDVKKEITIARNYISKYFGQDYEVIFTSCGSESDNTAIFSCSRRGNVITTEGEHSAVKNSFNELSKKGIEVRFAKLNKNGSVNLDHLFSLIDDNTTFVSVIHVNSETGAVNDINLISEKIKKINKNIIFHSDGVQAYLKIPHRIAKTVDLYSLSAHKIGAVKGVGALIKKKSLHLNPLIFGGGQESELRSGTENVYGIINFYKCAELRIQQLNENYNNATNLKRLFLENLNKEDFTLISDEECSPYIISISAKGLKGEIILHMLEDKGIIIGTGSACSSRKKHSAIIEACGYKSDVLDGVLRISLGFSTTKEEIITCVKTLNDCVQDLKKVMKK